MGLVDSNTKEKGGEEAVEQATEALEAAGLRGYHNREEGEYATEWILEHPRWQGFSATINLMTHPEDPHVGTVTVTVQDTAQSVMYGSAHKRSNDMREAPERITYRGAAYRIVTAGYTHYWSFERDFTRDEWYGLLEEVRRIIAAAEEDGIGIAGPMGTGNPEMTDSVIALNGKKPDDYESFILTRKFDEDAWNFTKTKHKPYDAVVVSILAAARDIAPDAIEPSSDGGPEAIRKVYGGAPGHIRYRGAEYVLADAVRKGLAEME